MSLWRAIADANKVFNYEQAFGAKDITSAEMQKALEEWYCLYYNNAKTKEEDPAQRLPAAVVGKLYKAIFSEYEASATRDSEFVVRLLESLDKHRKKAVQQMLIGGCCYLKPIPTAGGFDWTVIERPDMAIFARNDAGFVTDIGTAEQTIIGKNTYTLLERRQIEAGGYLVITSRLFMAETDGMLGIEVPLDTLDKYAQLVPVLRLPQPVYSVGLIPLRCPAENCVDGSADSVSVYAAASGLIHTVNRNEEQLNREFELGRLRLTVPDTMLRAGTNGTRNLYDDIFTPAPVADVDGDGGIVPFAPALREQSFIARKKEALRDIESLIGLKRGVLSDVETAEKTATEITSSAGEYNLTVKDFQEEWESCVREAGRVCAILGKIYGVQGAENIDPQDDIAINWGNGILYDEDKEWATLMQLVSAGILKPEIALGWKFDMPVATPEDLAAIREKYMPDEPENGEYEI